MTQLSDAFEDLSQSLRVLMEANHRAHREGLLQIDRAEAVGNIEIALASVLNSFHSLYDALEKEGHGALIKWYETPELVTILALRNARHHNLARKVRTMYSFYAQEAEKIGRMEMYVLVDFPSEEEGGDTFDVYLSWSDLKDLLQMPQQQSKLRPAATAAIADYIGSKKFKEYADYYERPEEHVFFNFVPLAVNAAIKVVPKIRHLVKPRSSESELVRDLFNTLLPTNTKQPEVSCGPIAFTK